MTSRRVFITGGGSGLGRALAQRYARAGFSVAIGDIDTKSGEETLKLLTGAPKTHFLKCDVREIADLEEAARWLTAEWGGVDVVYNNAGVAGAGPVAEFPLDDWQWLLDINVLGVVRGCKVFAPILEKQGSGTIVNIASLAGFVHPPRMAAYNATKAAVVALSESLHFELRGAGVQVSVVCPGFFRSNLGHGARATSEKIGRSMARMVSEARIDAAAIAETVYRGVECGKFVILPDAQARSAYLLKRMMPFAAYRKVLLRMFAPRKLPKKTSGAPS